MTRKKKFQGNSYLFFWKVAGSVLEFFHKLDKYWLKIWVENTTLHTSYHNGIYVL